MKTQTKAPRPTLTPEELETLRRKDEGQAYEALNNAMARMESNEWDFAAAYLGRALRAARRRAGT